LNNNEAFGRLVRLHQSKIRGFLRRLCRHDQTADDIAQDVFVIAYKRLRQYSGSGSFGGWLLRIAYRCFLQHQRQQRRQQLMHQQAQHNNELPVDTSAGVQVEYLDLERALAQIDATQAAAITLNLSMGFSHSEIADILEMPLGTVKSQISRGLKKLKDLMKENSQEQQS
jgi:RNA polymerase sigma factor (sigma-70 family)